MSKINSIISMHMESIEEIDNSPLSPENVENVENFINSGNEIDRVEDDLSSIEDSVEMVERVKDVQEANLSSVDQGIILKSPDEEPVKVRIEEVPEMIDSQIVSESFVMESAASRLGLKSELGLSATKQLYGVLGVNVKKINIESDATPVQLSIAKYRTHCEGFMSAVGKFGNLIWDGIIKLIRAIKEWIAKFFVFKKDIDKYCTAIFNKLESTPIENIQLIQDKIVGVSGPALVAGIACKDTPFENSYDLFEAIRGSVDDIERHEVKLGSRIGDGLIEKIALGFTDGAFRIVGSKIASRFDGLKKRQLKFLSCVKMSVKGGTGYYIGSNNSYGVLVSKGEDSKTALIRMFESDIDSYEIEFSSSGEVVNIIKSIIRSLLANIKVYERMSKDADKFMRAINEGHFIKIDDTASPEGQHFAKLTVAEYVKGTKNIICLPNVYLNAVKMLMGCIEIKK